MTATLSKVSIPVEVFPAEAKNAVAAELQQRVDRIKLLHAGTLRAFRDQMAYAFLAGVELLALKESTAHGDFGKLRKQYLGDIPERSQQRYMGFAEALKSKSATVADLAKQPLLLTNGQIEEQQAQKVSKAVHDFADGKTLTELYRDLGVIREPKKPGDVEHKQKKLSMAERHAQEVALAQSDWKALGIQLTGYGVRFTLLEDLDVQAQIALLEQMKHTRQIWLDTPKKQRDEKVITKLLNPHTTKNTKGVPRGTKPKRLTTDTHG
jgi:hypothetical protein